MTARELDDETRALMALSLVPGIGATLTMKLLSRFGSARACFAASEWELQAAGLPPRLVLGVQSAARTGLATDEEELVRGGGVSWVRFDDPEYPAMLARIYDPPPLLFLRGTIDPADEYAVAIVGSRRARPAARAQAREIAHGLACERITIVSGLALGVDSAAHQGALDAGGRTMAVMGCGLAHVYPHANEALAERVTHSGGLLSEFPMSVAPMAQNFPRRNRIMSGMSLATIVVEAPLGSGALITGDLALEHGRELLVVPWQDDAPSAAGSNRLIEDGATPVQSAEDVLAVLAGTPRPVELRGRSPLHASARRPARREETPPRRSPRPEGAPPDLVGDEASVWTALTVEPTHIDAVVHLTGLPAGSVGSALLLLEMKSLVRQFPGKRFARRAEPVP